MTQFEKFTDIHPETGAEGCACAYDMLTPSRQEQNLSFLVQGPLSVQFVAPFGTNLGAVAWAGFHPSARSAGIV